MTRRSTGSARSSARRLETSMMDLGSSKCSSARRDGANNPAGEPDAWYAWPRPFDRPLVGRERELDLLRWTWERTVREPGCHLFTMLGLAGVGKSRLVAELLASMGDSATVLRGRCL